MSTNPFTEMGTRAVNVLAAAGILTVEDLASRTRSQLLAQRALGPTTLAVIERFLAARSLSLAVSRFVAPEKPLLPEWLVKYEARAKSAGFQTERCESTEFSAPERHWWLSVRAKGASVSIFSADKFILAADIQDTNPRELMARAQVVIDALEIIAPEITERFTAKQEAA